VPDEVLDLSLLDYTNSNPSNGGDVCYRAYQIPDLYPHPAEPVANLEVADTNQVPVLEFSADPTLSYVIQASTNLTSWSAIGVPVQEGSAGDFDFTDVNAGQFTSRFYRVVTQ